jgi:hypothetical protein
VISLSFTKASAFRTSISESLAAIASALAVFSASNSS